VLVPTLRTVLFAGATVKVSVLAYAMWEAKQYRLRRVTVPTLAPGAEPLRVLHISDLHLTPSQQGKAAWVRRLAALRPDFVVNTGDNLAHPDAVETALSALDPLLDTPGVFVNGSNDYYGPVWKNPARYLLPDSGGRVFGDPLPWNDLCEGFTRRGWSDLNNRSADVKVRSQQILAVGTDDAHLDLDDYSELSVPDTAEDVLRLGVTHAPYRRVLDAMSHDQLDIIFAGHTHGGQLCIPGVGALVTNCDLPVSQAKGLHRRDDNGWLHVSAGLGTSPTAPVRFACPPEATLLTLVPRDRTDFLP
jgi:predicted MPP superfamily phosphohydrolase